MKPMTGLYTLGFDAWFGEYADAQLQPGGSLARVTAVDREAFLVHDGQAEQRAELAGRFRFATQSAVDLPCVGDWVAIQPSSGGGPALVVGVLPRRTCLRRKSPGKSADIQMIAANIDVAFIVQGCDYDFSVPRLERYLIVAEDGRLQSRIILSKTDLLPAAVLEERIGQIREAGITVPILPLSHVNGTGFDALQIELNPGRTFCLLGSSGVGKTTLINRLAGRAVLDTRAVSATGEGVHTTSRRQLLVLDSGAMLIDTPGMRELGLPGAGNAVAAAFGDIARLAVRCRFPDCSHGREPGCAVQAALGDGSLDERHFRSYLKLRKEAEYHDMSYAARRQKDRAFGKLVKSTLKQTRG